MLSVFFFFFHCIISPAFYSSASKTPCPHLSNSLICSAELISYTYTLCKLCSSRCNKPAHTVVINCVKCGQNSKVATQTYAVAFHQSNRHLLLFTSCWSPTDTPILRLTPIPIIGRYSGRYTHIFAMIPQMWLSNTNVSQGGRSFESLTKTKIVIM